MKKFLAYFLSIMMIISMAPTMTFATDGDIEFPEVSISASETTVTGDQVSVIVTIGKTQTLDVSAIDLMITYDSTKFTVVSATMTGQNAATSPQVTTENPGEIIFAAAVDAGMGALQNDLQFVCTFSLTDSIKATGGEGTFAIDEDFFSLSMSDDDMTMMDFPASGTEVTVTVPKPPISNVVLTGSIDTPVKYETDASSVTAEQNVDVELTWQPELVNNKFAADTEYTAILRVLPSEGESFANNVTIDASGIEISEELEEEFFYESSSGAYVNSAMFDKTAPKELTSMAVTTAPTKGKDQYTDGETFDPAGMVVTGTYDDESTAALTTDDYSYQPTGVLSKIAQQIITITATANNQIQTTFDLGAVQGKAVTADLFTVSPTEHLTYSGADQSSQVQVAKPQDLTSVTYTYKMGSDAVTEIKDAGEYKVYANVSGDAHYADASNIEIGSVTVDPLTRDVIWGTTALTYNGQAQAPTASIEGVGSDGTISLTVTGQKKNAGEGNTYRAFAAAPESGNYTLSEESRTKLFSIARAQITLSDVTVYTKEYDGNVVTGVSIGSTSGIIDNDKVYINPNARFSDANAGENKSVSITYSLYGDDKDNYTAPASQTLTGTITPKEVAVNWGGVHSLKKTYNGENQTPNAMAPGSVPGEIIFLKYLIDGEPGQKDVGAYAATAVIDRVENGLASNYKLTNAESAFQIVKKELTIESITANNKTYDGEVTAQLSLPSPVPGVVDADNSDVELAYEEATFEDKNVGENKTVTITGLDLSGPAAGNYALVDPPAQSTANITAQPVTVNWNDPGTLTFDGTEKTVTAEFGANEKVSGDDVSFVYENNSNTNAAVYNTRVTGLSGADAGNYSIASNPIFTYEIKQADLPDTQANQYLRSDEVQTGSYDYSFDLANVIQFTGLPENAGAFYYSEPAVEGQASYITENSLKIEDGKLKFTVDPPQAKDTELTINVTVGNQNYKKKSVPIKFTFMSKKDVSEQLALTIENKLDPNASLIYGDGFIVTGTYTNGDNAVASDVTASCVYKKGETTLEGVPTDAGTYTAVWTYEDNVEDGAFPGHLGTVEKEFTINPRPADVNWSNTELTYNGQPQKPTAKVTVLASDDGEIVADVSGEQTDAGDNYTATASITNTNYVLTDSTKTTSFSIAKKPVTVSGIKANNKEYNGSDAAELLSSDVTYEGIVTGDALGMTATGAFEDANAGENKTVIISDLELTGDAAKNYVLAESGQQPTATANITPKEVSLTWKVPEDLVYNGEIKSVTATAGGLLGTDTCDVTVENGAQINVGDYTAKAIGLSNPNYKLPTTGLEQAFAITKATLDLSATDVQTLLSSNVVSGAHEYSFAFANVINGIPEGETLEYSVAAGTYTGTVTDDNTSMTFTVAAPQAAGTTDSVVVTVKGNNYNDATVTVNFEFKDKIDVSNKLSVKDATITYGDTYTPEGVYEGHSYEAANWTFKDTSGTPVSELKDAGTYKIVATYEDNVPEGEIPGHVGTVSEAKAGTLTINPREVDVTWGFTDLTYNGQLQAPPAMAKGNDNEAITLSINGQQKDAGDNYQAEASISNATQANNYKLSDSTKTTNYSITKVKITISGIKANDKDYDGTTDAELDYSGVTYGGIIEGETLGVEATGAFADANAGEGKTVNLSGLKLTGDAAKNYELAASGQQTTATATINPKSMRDVDVDVDQRAFTYNGKVQKPAVTAVKLGNTTLKAGTDYEVSYRDEESVNANQTGRPYWMYVSGTGNYSGTMVIDYSINPKNLDSDDIKILGVDSQYEYTGKEIKPMAEVYDNGIPGALVEGTDYEAAYTDDEGGADVQSGGEKKITFTGKGNYTGEVTESYTINAASLTGTPVIKVNSGAGEDGAITTGTVLEADVSGVEGITAEDASYQWYRDDTEIDDATGATYTVTDDDADSEISVEITADTGNVEGVLVSDPVTVGKKMLEGSVEIDEDGDTITATVTGAPENSYEIVWMKDGEETEVTGPTYTVDVDEDAGSAITAKIVPKEDSGYTGEVVSDPVKIDAAAPAVTVNLTPKDKAFEVKIDVAKHGANITNYIIKVYKGSGTAGDLVYSSIEPASFENGNAIIGVLDNGEPVANGQVYTVSVEAVNDSGEAIGQAEVTPKASGGGGGGGGAIDDETNTITIPKVENGSATVSPKSAAAGEKVTVTLKADEGFEPDGVEVTDSKGKPVEVKDNGDGTYSFVMPDGPVTVTPKFKPADDHESVCPAKKFTDVDITQWYHLDLDFVLNEGMMNGTSDTTFDPQGTTNRAMIVTILYRLEGEPKAAEAPFTDLTQDWYKAAVGWAAENGIVKGTSATTFAPTDPITREQFATILYRYADYKKIDVSQKADLSKYTDQNKIHDYAKDAMSWANAAGLITGMTETTLQPTGNATRAQAAAIFHRFCENVAK